MRKKRLIQRELEELTNSGENITALMEDGKEYVGKIRASKWPGVYGYEFVFRSNEECIIRIGGIHPKDNKPIGSQTKIYNLGNNRYLLKGYITLEAYNRNSGSDFFGVYNKLANFLQGNEQPQTSTPAA